MCAREGVIPTSVPSFVVKSSAPAPALVPPIVSLGQFLANNIVIIFVSDALRLIFVIIFVYSHHRF